MRCARDRRHRCARARRPRQRGRREPEHAPRRRPAAATAVPRGAGAALRPVHGPRPQPAPEICSLHNGNIVTVSDEKAGEFGVSSLYQDGTTVFDFTGAANNPEIVLPETHFRQRRRRSSHARSRTTTQRRGAVSVRRAAPAEICTDDVWSTYWYNDFVYASSGRVQANRPGNRGLDVYMLVGKNGQLVDRSTGVPTVTTPQEVNRPNVNQFKGQKVRYMNPQTQDVFQNTSSGR